ncbi:MAG: hypothetical protein RLY70_3379, partial [Planctomycetota bacterium]
MTVAFWKRWRSAGFKAFSMGKASAEWLRRQNALRARRLRGELLESRLLMATEITSLDSLTLTPGSLTQIEIGGPTAGNPAGGTDID